MVKYSIFLKNKNNNSEYRHTEDLKKSEEDKPESFFTQTVCDRIRVELQQQTGCRIGDNDLKAIVQTWIEDIREGYRDSSISLHLPLIGEAKINNLQEDGNQEIPSLIPPDLSEIEPKLGAMPPLNFD